FPMKSSSRFMKFIGGRDIFFGLFLLILIGITILIYNKISSIFHPFIVIFSTIAPPIILTFIYFYIMYLIINLFIPARIKRIIVIFSTIAPPVILAFIAYYIMNPIVNLLERARIKRVWGILIIILGISGLLTGLIFLSAPAIEAQVKDLATRFPTYIKQMSEGIKSSIDHSFLGPYYDQGYEWVTSTLSDLPSKIGDYLGETFEVIMNVASTLTHVVVAIFTFPFILFFLLKDSSKFKAYCLHLLPPKFR